MLYHLVFFKLAPSATAADLVSRLEGLRGQIPSLIDLKAGQDISRAAGASWDVGLLTTFTDAEGLEAYRVHPKHQEVVSWIREHTSDRAVVDFQA